MNIWIFNHYATAPNHVGGSRHFDLSKQLVKKGHSVTIFASSFNHFSKQEMVFNHGDNRGYECENIEGVDYVWIHTPPYKSSIARLKNIFSYTRRAYKVAKKIMKREKPDVIIGSSVHPFAAIIAYLISRKVPDCKFYFEERDLWPQTFVDFGKISPKNPLTKILYKLEKFLYEKSDRVIVLFDKAQKYVESKGVDSKKILFIPNGVELERYKYLKRSKIIDDYYSGLEGKFIVVYTGSHGIANHLDPVIELFSKIRDESRIHLIMVGNGPEKERLMRMASKKDLINVSFYDSIPKSDIPYLLSRADMSIISILDSPLYKWGFSMNKLYDYMAAGLPIIMVANQSIVGELSKQDGVYVDTKLDNLAKVIIEYANSEDKSQSQSQNLKQYVEKTYSWDILSDRLESVIINDTRD